MKEFTIIRDHMNEAPTTGQLFMPNDLSFYTLEDPWLDNAKEISCIPTGVYRCILSTSARFNRVMPEILGVPGRTGIRVHGGNTVADTEGCVLLGMSMIAGPELRSSQQALGFFAKWLRKALTEGSVYCEVTSG